MAPQRTRLHRLGQMRHRPGRGQRVAHEQPARARLHRHIDPPAGKPRRPARHGRRRGIDPPATHPARLAVQRVEGDLRSTQSNPATIATRATFEFRQLPIARTISHRAEGARVHAIFAQQGPVSSERLLPL
jgi:hypothetical protein